MVVVLTSSKPNHPNKRLQAKLDHLLHLHHHHQKPEAESGSESLQAFRAKLSDGLRGLIVDSEEFSLTWVQQGFKLLHGLNSGFTKLIEGVDCPMSKWESRLVDEYLGYTLEVLDLLNLMSSTLSHLQSLRLSLAHTLCSPSPASKRLLKSAANHDHDHDHHPRKWAIQEERGTSKGDGGALNGKQGAVLEAVVEMKGVALWVCRVIVCGFGGEMKVGNEFPVLVGVDARAWGEIMEKGGVFKEVREVKEMVDGVLLSATAPLMMGEESKEMERKVESFQRKLEEAVEEVNSFFSLVLASRNRLMDCFRLDKH